MAFRLLPGGRRIAGSRETLFANGVRRRGHCRENESFVLFDREGAL